MSDSCETKMGNPCKIALCQMAVTGDKEKNLRRATECVGEAADGGARIVCLPEIWNSPYDVKLFGDYIEPADGPSAALMARLAQRHGICLIGGSILELDAGAPTEPPREAPAEPPQPQNPRVYNTSFVFGPSGDVIARHRKAHLFDIDIEKGIRFKESDFLSAGDGFTVFDTEYGKIGLAICFDLRFPEMFSGMTKAGAHAIFLPASFNMTTGPAHWDLLIRARALDNQVYLAACASARNLDAPYISWGHSCVATPWGELCAAADAREAVIFAIIDLGYLNKVRREIPIGNPPL